MKPEISIVMSCYNHEKFIAKAIQSVQNQTFKNWELLITDDCSTDQTLKIAKSYSSDKIKVGKSPYNRGMVRNLNELIEKSKGKYIAFINSDDFWEESKLEQQLKFLDKNPDYSCCFTLANMVDEKDKILHKAKNHFPYFEKTPDEWLNYFFYFGNCLCFPSALVRKSTFDKVGLINPAYICLLDLDLWMRICLQDGKIKIINQKLTNFRIIKKGNNLSGNNRRSNNRGLIESEIINYNYLLINNYERFTKIFTNYKSTNKYFDSWLCLTDLILKSNPGEYIKLKKISKLKKLGKAVLMLFGIRKTNNKIKTQKRFLVRLINQKITEDKNNLNKLEQYSSFSFKKYLNLTSDVQ